MLGNLNFYLVYTSPLLPIGMPRTRFVSILIPIFVTVGQRVMAYALVELGIQ